MDLAARPHITAGIALASIAVLAAGPMAQHLPDLRSAAHLSEVSVSAIQLTDASGVLDLFAGVENELASLVGGASAAAVPAAALSDVFSPITQSLIVQTWANTFTHAGANLQFILNQWSATPFPVLQQLAANGVQYASDYVGPYQIAANALVKLIPTLGPAVHTGLADIAAGKVSTGISALFNSLLGGPIVNVGLPLVNILSIPGYITQNFANATNYLLTTGVPNIATYALDAVGVSTQGLGASLQATYNAWSAGDTLGALTNLLNTPGAVTNAVINGFQANVRIGITNGLLSSGAFPGTSSIPTGLLNEMLNTLDPGLAKAIVAPNAQNIVSGGSFVTAIQNFANQLINGWPSLNSAIGAITGDISGSVTSLLRGLPSTLSSLPSILGNIATHLGTLVIQLLSLL
ncbi:hypothetical protein MHEI_02940 [Mycobacterium heidelbergense]|nr:hypothetical protein MHEI_02940 [Mycobacterium heidelbergense]